MKTNLITYREPLVSVFDDIDRMFGGFFAPDIAARIDRRMPAVDVRETKDGYVIDVELPGLDEKDVDLKLSRRVLTIASAKKEDREEKKDGWLIRERKGYEFQRSFQVPEDLDPESVKASFAKGLLTIELGKKPETQDKVIQINAK
jgi:HSP20 family protein